MKRLHPFRYSAAAVAAIAALAFSPVAPAQTPTKGGTATAWLSRDFDGFDAIKVPAAHQARYQILTAVGDLLFEADPETGESIPRLALEADHSDDYLLWTVKLRPGVKFSNGEDLTGQAYVDHFTRLLTSDLKGVFNAELGQELESVTSPDPLTVEFHFSAPARAFGAAMAAPLYLWYLNAPGFAKENQDKPDYSLMSAGNGPYMVKSYEVGSHVVLERNPHFWNPDEQHFDEITYRIVTAPETGAPFLQTLAGDMDMMWTLGPTIPLAENDDRVDVVYGYRNTMLGQVNFNTEKEPFNDLRVRRALAHAIDRHMVAELISEGTAQVADQSYPEGFAYHCDGIDYISYDPEAAKALLAEYGKPLGKIELWVDFPITMRTAAETIQEMWSQIGLDVEVNQGGTGAGAFVRAVAGGEASVWITAGGYVLHPSSYGQNLRTGAGDNNWRMSSPAIDAAIDRVNAAETPEDLMEAHCAFEQVKADELPFILYAHMPIGVVYNKRIQGVQRPFSAAVGYHRAYVAE